MPHKTPAGNSTKWNTAWTELQGLSLKDEAQLDNGANELTATAFLTCATNTKPLASGSIKITKPCGRELPDELYNIITRSPMTSLLFSSYPVQNTM